MSKTKFAEQDYMNEDVDEERHLRYVEPPEYEMGEELVYNDPLRGDMEVRFVKPWAIGYKSFVTAWALDDTKHRFTVDTGRLRRS